MYLGCFLQEILETCQGIILARILGDIPSHDISNTCKKLRVIPTKVLKIFSEKKIWFSKKHHIEIPGRISKLFCKATPAQKLAQGKTHE